MHNNVLLKAFACCHSVHLVNNELIGDEIDVKMLKFSKYVIENGKNYKFRVKNIENTHYMQVNKIWEFES